MQFRAGKKSQNDVSIQEPIDSDKDGNSLTPVSYTHLDVYKRQVYVCTPNRSHSFITVDALHSGKHVMCEKPMAINYTEGKKMLDAARETGRLLTIAYQNRYRPDSQFLKAECEEGRLGEVYYAKAKALRRRAVPTWGCLLYTSLDAH